MEHSRFLAGLILTALLSQVSPFEIDLKELEDKVFLSCNTSIIWLEGTTGTLASDTKSLDLGKRMQDPRGVYRCNTTDKQMDKETTLQVYFRMCQNCVELDSATLAGIIITDIIATLLLAVGVYCFAGHETGRVSGAADTQALLRNDQLYQPLRGHNDAQYSRLGENWARNRRT
ncbi:T-cell surface glycoprotein CD3 delta chain [Camelus dromedarius]|uniref:T-cell surface glycoprotein CD3 delta chain n=1 Tax=Camelus dromedarius TaxID=9838 RepID=A0A5N4C867_CAMDR|nr:T-cell surface glycoprotein CD3 delta chain [Camelus dromedarius]KAB1255102.1 T-cell surface glycoprotein CD3 delta chain [Camelus dromedarius]